MEVTEFSLFLVEQIIINNTSVQNNTDGITSPKTGDSSMVLYLGDFSC